MVDYILFLILLRLKRVLYHYRTAYCTTNYRIIIELKHITSAYVMFSRDNSKFTVSAEAKLAVAQNSDLADSEIKTC